MTRFGDFGILCAQTPSYPWCNLFYRQVPTFLPSLSPLLILLTSTNPFQVADNSTSSFFTGSSADPASAPVGVNPECGILRAGHDGSLGNIANIIVCALSMLLVAALIVFSSRRKAAVGEFSSLFRLCAYSECGCSMPSWWTSTTPAMSDCIDTRLAVCFPCVCHITANDTPHPIQAVSKSASSSSSTSSPSPSNSSQQAPSSNKARKPSLL